MWARSPLNSAWTPDSTQRASHPQTWPRKFARGPLTQFTCVRILNKGRAIAPCHAPCTIP
eukprot:4770661-Prorocentrum_lima.AAC.1